MPDAPAIQTGELTLERVTGVITDIVGQAFAEERQRNIANGRQILQSSRSGQLAMPLPSDHPDRIAQAGAYDDRGLTFAGVVRALRVAQMAGAGGPAGIAYAKEWAAKNMSYNPAVAQALDTTSFGDGGALVPAAVISEVVEFLRPASTFRSMNPEFGRFEANGKYSIGRIVTGFTASRTGENRSIALTAATTGTIDASPKKCTAMYVTSAEFLRRATPEGDRILRNDLSRSITQRQDLDYWRGDGTQFSVKGVKNTMQSGNSTSATASPTLQQVFDDLGDLWLAIRDADFGGPRLGWGFNPRTTVYLWTRLTTDGHPVFREEMAAGTLWGAPYRDTNLIPRNLGGGGNESEIYLVNFAGLVVLDGENIELAMSDQASYTSGSDQVSAFEKGQILTRAIAYDDLLDRYPGKTAAMKTAVTWGA